MVPRIFPAAAIYLMLMASVANAGIPEEFAGDRILAALNERLVAEGFEIVSVRVTFLRRYKIEAHAPGIDREIVLAPGTGAILRDKQENVSTETPEPILEEDSEVESSRAYEAGALYSEPDSDEDHTDEESEDEDEDSSQSGSDD